MIISSLPEQTEISNFIYAIYVKIENAKKQIEIVEKRKEGV